MSDLARTAVLSRCLRLGVAVFGMVWYAAVPALGQDLEMTAQVMGRTLPQAYYETIRERPDFFEIAQGWTAKSRHAAQAHITVAGTLPVAVVLALFSDSPEPAIPAAEVQRVLFDGPATWGTLTEYYEEVSGGQLTVTGTVLPWVRTQTTREEAAGRSDGPRDIGDHLVEAMAAADATTDFGQFDNDGPDGMPNSGDDDGFVDALAIEFTEISASCGGPAIWPHRSRISNRTESPFETNDLRPGGEPIFADDYIVQSVVSCDGAEIQTASTIAHEMGHILGLPDLYDRTEGTLPTLRSWVVGCWSLMAAGSWGCGTSEDGTGSQRPPHFGPWEKMTLGWLSDLRTVGELRNEELVLEPVRESESVLRIPLSSSEYLLVEYRDGTGFDQNLPTGGVLIYHVDENRVQRRCRTCDRIYHVALVEADGNGTLVRLQDEGGNRGEAGDVFSVAGPQRLTNSTTPSTRLHSGAASHVSFYEIAIESGVARLVISTTTIPLASLLEPFVQGPATPLSTDDLVYLDAVGNKNGGFDVGDLRAYLQEHPSVTALAEVSGAEGQP